MDSPAAPAAPPSSSSPLSIHVQASAPSPPPPNEDWLREFRQARQTILATAASSSPARGGEGVTQIEVVRMVEEQNMITARGLANPLPSSSSSSSCSSSSSSPSASPPRPRPTSASSSSSSSSSSGCFTERVQQRLVGLSMSPSSPRSLASPLLYQGHPSRPQEQLPDPERHCLPSPPPTLGEGDDGMDSNNNKYGYLLTMMGEGKEQARQQQARIQELEHALLETRQECEVALASTRLESHELKCMLRRMAAESTFADVFQIYEAHIARVEQEAQALRERNVQLELRRQQQQQQYITTHHHAIPDEEEQQAEREENKGRLQERRGGGGNLHVVGTASKSKIKQMGRQLHHLQNNSKKASKSSTAADDEEAAMMASASLSTSATTATATLRARVKDLQRQVGDLKQENTELRRRERQFLVQKRMVETTWARVQKVQTMAKGLEGSLASSRLDAARAEARVVEAEEEIFALREREQALVLDRDRALLELELVQRQLSGGGGGRRRSSVQQGSQAHTYQGGWEG